MCILMAMLKTDKLNKFIFRISFSNAKITNYFERYNQLNRYSFLLHNACVKGAFDAYCCTTLIDVSLRTILLKNALRTNF